MIGLIIGTLLLGLGVEILKKCMTLDNNFVLILISVAFGVSGFSFILDSILPDN